MTHVPLRVPPEKKRRKRTRKNMRGTRLASAHRAEQREMKRLRRIRSAPELAARVEAIVARVEAILLEDWQKKTEAERTEWAMQKAWKAQNVQNAQDLQKARAKMQKERVDLGGSWTDTWTGHLRHAYSSMHVRMSSRRVAPPVHNAAVAPLAAPSEAIGGEGGKGGVLAECQHVYIACISPITAEIMTDPVSTLDGFTY